MSGFSQFDDKLNMVQDAFFADQITVEGQEPFSGIVELIPHEFSGVNDALAVIDLPAEDLPAYIKRGVKLTHAGRDWTVKFANTVEKRAYIYLE